jgi:hypothetical protein
METLDVNKMMALVSGGDNLLQQYFNSNKSPKALGLSTTIGLILNHISQRNATDNGTHSHAILSPHQVSTSSGIESSHRHILRHFSNNLQTMTE